MTKKNWIYLSSVILIIIVAIVGMIAFVHFKYGNQTEDNTQKEAVSYTHLRAHET